MIWAQTATVYALAALGEIAGCFAFWAWWRLGASALWLIPGVLALAAFGWLLALSPAAHAGQAYAAYAGVYLVASVLWLWGVEGVRPISWDLLGAGLALAGAAVILFAPRGA